jgi:hypothetical protein
MTNEEARALYARAVAAGFRLEPGCRAWVAGQLVTIAWADEYEVGCAGDGCTVMLRSPADAWCDFREASSLGCLLGQVRAAWGDPYMVLRVRDVQTSATCREPVIVWCVDAGPGRVRMEPMGALHRMTMAQWRTEAEALVAALESAPKVQP